MSEKDRKKNAGKISVRDRLIDSAYELFNRDGIHKTGIDKIIKNAGVAKMSFYSHFPSKRDLVIEYLKVRDKEWFDLISSFVDKVEKPEEKLVQIFEALKSWFDQDNFYGCPFINGLAEFEELDNPNVSACISQHFDKTGELLAELLQQMDQSNKDLPAKISMIIVGAIVLAQATKSSAPAMMAKDVTLQVLSQQ